MSRYVAVGPDRHRTVVGDGAHIGLTIGIKLEDTDAVEVAVRRWQIADTHVPVDVAAMRGQIHVCYIHCTPGYKLPLPALPR